MNPEDLYPTVEKAWLDRLEETFPERCPDESWTDRQIWIYVGQRNVVRMLQAIYIEQQNEA
jgi:hypothetical protein